MRIMAALAVSMMATGPSMAEKSGTSDLSWLPAPTMKRIVRYATEVCPTEFEAMAEVDYLRTLRGDGHGGHSFWSPTNDSAFVNAAAEAFFFFRPLPDEIPAIAAWTMASSDAVLYLLEAIQEDRASGTMEELAEAVDAVEKSLALAKCLDLDEEFVEQAAQKMQELSWVDSDTSGLVQGKRMFECTRWLSAMEAVALAYREGIELTSADPKGLQAKMYVAFQNTFVPCDKEKLQ